jgi:hypothetical protein
MRLYLSAFFGTLLMAMTPAAFAVYAPIPEVEQGKAFTVYAAAGAYYDSNIFGGSTDTVGSYVYRFDPSVAFNASLEAKTFVSASYRLTYDYMPDRPGKKDLDSHAFSARFAHTFTPQMELDVSDTYQISRNPASLLPGVATVVNTDQSYRRNQLDVRYATSLTKRTGLTFKGRDTRYNYDDDNLGRSLDREELLGGLTFSHTLLRELQAMAEYRHLVIDYATGGAFKNKRSDFGLVGMDYAMNAKFSLSGRLGVEHRRREGEGSDTLPYAELGVKFDHGQNSYVSFGYGYSVEETSNIELYSDTSVNRFFVNVQQALLPQLAATASLTWEPSRLHGRKGVRPDQDETNTQTGLALIYQPSKRWSVSVTWDYDHVSSDDASRQLVRNRTGLSARYVF